MAKGATISITIPIPLLNHYDKQAEDLGTSRSKLILAVLLEDYMKNKEPLKEEEEPLLSEEE